MTGTRTVNGYPVSHNDYTLGRALFEPAVRRLQPLLPRRRVELIEELRPD
jgi:hypothetical protein